jgi:hypothetical protein
MCADTSCIIEHCQEHDQLEILGIPMPLANAKENAQSCLDKIAL